MKNQPTRKPKSTNRGPRRRAILVLFRSGPVPDGPSVRLALANQELHRRAMDRLTGPERRILEPLLAAWPNALSNEDVAAAAAYSVISTSYTNPRGHLAALGLITYPQSGQVRAADVLFPEDFR